MAQVIPVRFDRRLSEDERGLYDALLRLVRQVPPAPFPTNEEIVGLGLASSVRGAEALVERLVALDLIEVGLVEDVQQVRTIRRRARIRSTGEATRWGVVRQRDRRQK